MSGIKKRKGNGRVWIEDGNCTQSAFRENVFMHWNSLFESADDGAGNRDFATSILDEAAIFLAVRKKEI